jgi:exodeoxyribonuclease-3
MKIISWNTNGLRATVKQDFFLPLFKKYKPEIVCLQETKAEPEQLSEEVLRPSFAGAMESEDKKYYSYFSSSKVKKGYSGVAIYTAVKPLEVFSGMSIKRFDDEGRLLGVKYKDFTLITGYYPNGGQGPHRLKYKLEFYEAFLKFILKLRKNGERVIFCGDINTSHHEIDLARPKENVENTGFLPIERAWLDKVVKNNFADVFREFYPDKKGAYTYWDQKTRARDRNVGWRLDYFFADKKLLPKIKDIGMLTDYYGSDHCPIFMDINI